MDPTRKTSFAALITATLIAISGTLIAISPASSASAEKSDLVWFIDRTYREVIDIKGDGDNTGDITVTNGIISEVRGGEPVGTYSTSQITAFVAIPGGRQNRQTTLAMKVGKNTIYTMALVSANAGTPPRKKITHAIIGGTGKYSGVRGEVVLRPLTDTLYRVSFYFVD
jgi:hypothetical protein|tara:strand:+ start:1148 stop:1654 length:507 start_codon:yes stop_codon:yes gene_type:complete